MRTGKTIKRIFRWILLICLLLIVSECGSAPAPYEEYPAEETPEVLRAEAPEAADQGETSLLQVHYIDVGQGDCTLVCCDGHAMLIDAGDNSKGTLVQLYLTKQGISSLDYVIGTHPDADHIGGLDVIITKFDCGRIMMPDISNQTASYRDVVEAMDYRGYQNTAPQAGSSYLLGSASFTVIAPVESNYENTNNYSIGIKLVHGDNSFIFMGDAEEEAEEDILKSGADIQSDVLKVGHHGSRTSTSAAFLEAVNPAYAVISCGEGNSYGHPHAETLNNLRSRGIKVFRTDEQGSIVATSDGRQITFNCASSESWQAGEETGVATQTQSTVNYILNTNTYKFHNPDCPSVEDIAEKNKQESGLSRDEIIALGYAPCKRCNP